MNVVLTVIFIFIFVSFKIQSNFFKFFKSNICHYKLILSLCRVGIQRELIKRLVTLYILYIIFKDFRF